MIGIIYRTTCLITFDKYIGKHACKSTSFDGYLGSGKHLKRAIDKYGRNNFIRQIIRVVDDDEDIDELERYYIRINDAVNRSDYYNIQEGGEGFGSGKNHPYYGKPGPRLGMHNSKEANKKTSESKRGKSFSVEHKKHLSESHKGKPSPKKGTHRGNDGAGRPMKKCRTKEYPNIIFESYSAAEILSIQLGWIGVNQKNITRNISGKGRSCGKDSNGNKLHWEDVL